MRILTLAGSDVRLTLRDRSSIFWIFIAPFLWVYIFGTAMGGSNPQPVRLGLTVIQEDDSDLASRFVPMLEAENFSITVIGPGEDATGTTETAARILTIPKGFGDAIRERRKVLLHLEEGANANPDGTFAVQVALHKATVRLLAGEALGAMEPGGDAVQLVTSWGEGRPVPRGYSQTIPGNLVMFVLLSTMTYGAALLVQERKGGILRRLAAAPLGRARIIAGKLLGRTAVAAVQVVVFVVMAVAIFRIDWGRSPAGLACVIGGLVLTAAAFGMLGGAFFRSADAAAGVGVVLTLVMSALGGCWWPAEVMPQWMRTASLAFPTAWAMDGLHQIISWRGGLIDVLPHTAALLAFAAAAGGLAAWRLRVTE